MRAKEFIYEDLEEGWKDKIAGAAMAMGALGGHANVDAKPVSQIEKPAITKQIQAPQKVAPHLWQWQSARPVAGRQRW